MFTILYKLSKTEILYWYDFEACTTCCPDHTVFRSGSVTNTMEAQFFSRGLEEGGIIKRESLADYQGEILTGDSHEFLQGKIILKKDFHEFPRTAMNGRL